MSSSGGQLGNQNAKKAKIWEQAIKRALSRASGSIDSGLDTLADKLVAAAQNGDQWALIEVGNRLDGKPAQAIVGGDEDSEPIKFERVIRLVKADAGT